MAQIGRKGGESRQSAARANAEKNTATGNRGGGSEQATRPANRQSGKADSDS